MNDQHQPTEKTPASEPERISPVYTPVAPSRQAPVQKRKGKRIVVILAIVLLSFAAGGAGSYALISSGLVSNSHIIESNRERVVSQEGDVMSDVYNRLSPSVVSITTKSVSNSGFRQQVSEGAGSGVIISEDGYVMTNKHVVPEGTNSVTVIASDGTEYTNVSVVGRDSVNDIAFLKIANVSNLKKAEIGDSTSVKVGQKVLAIGNALGEFQNSLTSGIISGIGRPVQASSGNSAVDIENLENLFQTDAAINPGNSGGPLLNISGQVIGINTAVAEDAQGIGFAIPINDAKGLIRTVLETGKVQRGVIGVRYTAIDAALAKSESLPVTEGALLGGSDSQPAIISGGAADKAGLRSGDIITKVNDEKITSGNSLAGLLGEYKPGDTVTITVLRGGNEQSFKVTLQAS